MRMFAVAVLLLTFGAAPALAQGGTVHQTAAQGGPAVQTIAGQVSCDWQVAGRYECRRRTRQDCIRECVSAGSAYVLVADKRMYWLSGGASELAEAAGGAAVVTGVVDGKKVSVLSIADGEKHRGLRSWK